MTHCIGTMSTKHAARQSNRFRETLWFKRGDDDSTAADAARDAAIAGQVIDLVAIHNLPIEDRYLDDGSVTADDSKRYSLRTGATMPLAGPCSPEVGATAPDATRSSASPHSGE